MNLPEMTTPKNTYSPSWDISPPSSRAALEEATKKDALEKTATEKAAADKAAEEVNSEEGDTTPKRHPLIGRSQGKASLWDSKENKQLSSQPTKVASSQGSQFNGYVLGLPWEPGSDLVSMHMGVNLSAKKQKVRLGDKITLDTLGKIDDDKPL